MTSTQKESNTTQEFNLENALKPLLQDLLYPSESDEPIEYVNILPEEQELIINDLNIKQVLALDENIDVECISVEDFFEPITTIKEWFGDEEKKQVENALAVQQLIAEHLKNLQGFRIGETEISLWLLGQDENHNWKGLKTLLIET